MRVSTYTREIWLYATWYEFKKDFEKRLGYSLLNWRWLEVKPKAPLPWDDSHMQAALSAAVTLEEQNAERKRERNG